MTAQELAARLNGRQVGQEITPKEAQQAGQSNLVVIFGAVIFGASVDIIELRGAIDDEVDAPDGGECYIKNGKLLPALDDETELEVLDKYGVLEIVQTAHRDAIEIVADWDVHGYSWFITTEYPFSPFEILDGKNKYCRGIVISLANGRAK